MPLNFQAFYLWEVVHSLVRAHVNVYAIGA